MKKYSWLFAILGVAALGMALMFGAAFGAGITYFFLQADSVQAAFTAPVNVDNEEGVLISGVKPDSATAEAGLVRGDIVLEINGEPVNNIIEMKEVLAGLKPGDVIELTVLHGDDTRSITAELGDNVGLAYLGVDTCGSSMDGSKMFTDPSSAVVIKGFGFGAEVTEVITGSPAEDAGLQAGDMILSVDGEAIGLEASLADLIQSHEPGDTVTLEVQSAEADESHEVEVTLGENADVPRQAYLGVAYRAGASGFKGDELPFGELPEGFDDMEGMPHFFHPGEGFEGELPEGQEENMPHFFEIPQLPEGVEGAVIISEVIEDTPAEEVGLQPNDLILAVDDDTVTEIEAFIEALQSHKPGDKVTLTVFRSGEEFDVQVTLAEHPDDPEKGFLGVLAGTLTLNLPDGFDQDFELELPGVPGGDA